VIEVAPGSRGAMKPRVPEAVGVLDGHVDHLDRRPRAIPRVGPRRHRGANLRPAFTLGKGLRIEKRPLLPERAHSPSPRARAASEARSSAEPIDSRVTG